MRRELSCYRFLYLIKPPARWAGEGARQATARRIRQASAVAHLGEENTTAPSWSRSSSPMHRRPQRHRPVPGTGPTASRDRAGGSWPSAIRSAGPTAFQPPLRRSHPTSPHRGPARGSGTRGCAHAFGPRRPGPRPRATHNRLGVITVSRSGTPMPIHRTEPDTPAHPVHQTPPGQARLRGRRA